MRVYRGEQTDYKQHWACPANRDAEHERRTFLASLSFSLSLPAASCYVSRLERRGRQLHHSEEKHQKSATVRILLEAFVWNQDLDL